MYHTKVQLYYNANPNMSSIQGLMDCHNLGMISALVAVTEHCQIQNEAIETYVLLSALDFWKETLKDDGEKTEVLVKINPFNVEKTKYCRLKAKTIRRIDIKVFEEIKGTGIEYVNDIFRIIEMEAVKLMNFRQLCIGTGYSYIRHKGKALLLVMSADPLRTILQVDTEEKETF